MSSSIKKKYRVKQEKKADRDKETNSIILDLKYELMSLDNLPGVFLLKCTASQLF